MSENIYHNEEIDLREIYRILWATKKSIGAFALGGTLVALFVALVMPDIYRAEALLVPNRDPGSGDFSARALQYGDLASLAGIKISSGAADKTAVSLETLRSRKFLSEFVERHDLLVSLMATEGWDSETGELIIDPDLYDVTSMKWTRDAKPPKKLVPSSQESYDRFVNETLTIFDDPKTGFVTIAVEHYSPRVAKKWVDWLVEDINSTMMLEDVREAQEAIKFLERQIEGTSLSELKNVFFRLIEEQTKTVMLAQVSKEYVFRTIDPAVEPELRVRPKRLLITVAGFAIGLLLGIAFAIGGVRGSGKTV